MRIIGLLEVLIWVLFAVVWFVTAFQSKRNLRPAHWWQSVWLRIILFIVLYTIFRERIDAVIITYSQTHPENIFVAATGVVLSALGVAFAIWARTNIGTNWGMPMSLKENRELVTSGPYKYVRHPIYSGMLLAAFGATLVVGIWWLPIFALVAIYFIYSATSEEKTLTKEFPNEYPAYKKRTKMLVPFAL